MEQIMTPLIQLGAVGILLIILIIAVKVLYNRNTKLNDRLYGVMLKNTEAYLTHATAINQLTTVVSGVTEVIHKCKAKN